MILQSANDIPNSKKMNGFLEQCKRYESWRHFSFLILVVDREVDHLGVGRFVQGNGWLPNPKFLEKYSQLVQDDLIFLLKQNGMQSFELLIRLTT